MNSEPRLFVYPSLYMALGSYFTLRRLDLALVPAEAGGQLVGNGVDAGKCAHVSSYEARPWLICAAGTGYRVEGA